MSRRSAQPVKRPAPLDIEESVLFLLVLLEPLVFTTFTRNPFAVKELLFAVALVTLAIARIAGVRAGRGSLLPPLLPTAALVLVVAVNALFAALSPDRGEGIAFSIRLLGYAAFFLLAASRAWDVRFLKRIFAAVLAGTIAAAIYGLLQVANLDPMSWADTFRAAGAPLATMRMFSTFGHPNFFGSHLAMALFLMAALAFLAERPLTRIAAAAGIVLGAVCLLLTLNRGAWVGFAAAAGLLVWLAWRALRLGGPLRGDVASRSVAPTPGVLAVIAGVTLLAVLAAAAGSPQVRRRLAVDLGEPTVQSRLLIWEAAVKMIRARPLAGFGPGTFGRVFPFYRDERLSEFHDELTPVTHAHNEYLEIAAETGMIGLAAMVTFLAVVIHEGLGRLRIAASREEWVTTAALLAGAAGRRNFFISSGCDIPYAAPLGNLEAFFSAVHRFNA